ncbi:MAG: HEAT repeat domain-containing protein, partial [Desulfuromonadales bacterium]|nr:HEAT repeat domain-containing protein [Desulfuromonadales bacterium]NIR32943.1 HEAT repeat domain-containing protein [Desulfuromonadales bacterium]NIS39846.1 HEAT repeat domain-containing protein [Desulfuromonadales bacterium]
MRRQALLALGALRNPAAVPPLLKILGNKEDFWGRSLDTRKDIIRALGEIGSPEAIDDLISILSHRRVWRRNKFDTLRAAAAWALGEIGAAQALPALEKAAEDRSEDVVRMAMQALKQIRREQNATGTD